MAKAATTTSKPAAALAVVEDDGGIGYLTQFEGKGPIRGDDNFDRSDVAIPRIKLLQGLSPECESFDSAKPGQFWHTGADLSVGNSVRFIPITRRKKLLLTTPIDDKRGVLARSEDMVHWSPPEGEFEVKLKGMKKPVTWTLKPTVAESGLDQWGSSNPEDPDSPPAATLFYEYLVILPDHMELGPVVMSLTRSNIAKAKRGLNDKIEMHKARGRPMQCLVFIAESVTEEGAEGPFKNWMFKADGFAPKALYDEALSLAEALSGFKVRDEDATVRDASEQVGGGGSPGAHTPF